jgi:hypothetical protein
MNETAHAIGHAERELRDPVPGLLLLACSAAIVPGLLVALVLRAGELVKAIRRNGWRDFDAKD